MKTLDGVALFSPVWWEDTNAPLTQVDKYLKSLDSQFRRCYAYRDANHRPEDAEQLRSVFLIISDMRKNLAPFIKWSQNSVTLGIDELSHSEKEFVKALMFKIDIYTATAYQSWKVSIKDWEKMNFHVSMSKITSQNQLLNSIARRHVETTSRETILSMQEIKKRWNFV